MSTSMKSARKRKEHQILPRPAIVGRHGSRPLDSPAKPPAPASIGSARPGGCLRKTGKLGGENLQRVERDIGQRSAYHSRHIDLKYQ